MITISSIDVEQFRTQGFVLLRCAFEPERLSSEVDRALEDSRRGTFSAEAGGGTITGRYVPMMCERTPQSLLLLDRFEPVAQALLGARVLPTRAKGVLYADASPWHRDSTHDVSSVGLAAYLESLAGDNGALRVVAGSHRPEYRTLSRESLPLDCGQVIETEPGDVIAFDEHLLHSSSGGRNRRQWRIDYVLDPVGVEDEARVRGWYVSQHPPDWNGGYDVDRYPSYGPHWKASGRRSVARLRELGVYEAAAKEEAFARTR
jgi:Phytanoyl-CoA dioxygenase (PhyH)